MSELLGQFKQDFILSRSTSWHVGGPAKRYYRPANLEDLSNYLKHYHDGSPIVWLGLGSNVLIRDAGIQSTVIHTLNKLNVLEWQGDQVYVQAGVPCAKFAKWCMREGLAGAEFLAGIPGTMGGALRMNAGAYGGETWDLVQKVQLLDPKGELIWLDAKAFAVGYRSVEGFGDCMFAGALFKLTSSTSEAILEYTKNMLQKRNAAQPIGSFNCGSVFRNPEGDYAGRLIAACGLQGYVIGDAEVSHKHANFIINRGNATAENIEQLIEHIQKEVSNKTGIVLYRECHLLGDRLGVTTKAED
jgi:UDP-N-acetylmuramate dehydrogenase